MFVSHAALFTVKSQSPSSRVNKKVLQENSFRDNLILLLTEGSVPKY